MSQNYLVGEPAQSSLVVSSVVRNNFSSLLSSNAGETAPTYGADGVVWYKPSTRILHLYTVGHFEPFVKFDVSGNVEEIYDPRLLSLWVENAFTGAASSSITRVAGKVTQLTEITTTGFHRITVINRNAEGKVSSTVTSVTELAPLARTETFTRTDGKVTSTNIS